MAHDLEASLRSTHIDLPSSCACRSRTGRHCFDDNHDESELNVGQIRQWKPGFISGFTNKGRVAIPWSQHPSPQG
jgi:hypothetical protein